MGSLSSLEEMRISINRLSGTIPVAVASLRMLHYVSAHDNGLSGSIPDVLMSVPYIVLNDNHLTGSLATLRQALVLILVRGSAFWGKGHATGLVSGMAKGVFWKRGL